MSSKATKVPAEIRFYVVVLENLNQRAVPRGGWRTKATKPLFSCVLLSFHPGLAALRGVSPRGSNMLNRTRGFSAGSSVPLEDVAVAGGSTVAGPVVMVSGDPSHQSAFIQALP